MHIDNTYIVNGFFYDTWNFVNNKYVVIIEDLLEKNCKVKNYITFFRPSYTKNRRTDIVVLIGGQISIYLNTNL